MTDAPPATQAAQDATDTIPIVMAVRAAPVEAGGVASLARPGGNVTGLSIMAPGLGSTRLALLKAALPTVSRVAVLGRTGHLTSAGAEALITLADAVLWHHRARVVTLTAQHRLPALFPEREFADAGGCMAYGPSVPESFRRAASYVDRILKGAKPEELPGEQPTQFALVINLKTTKALGLMLPPPLLFQATEVSP